MRILVAEDGGVLAKTFKGSLEKAGYTVDYLSHGEDIEKRIFLNNHKYKLLILDWKLPSKESMKICKDIREMKISIPILIITTHSGIRDEIATLNAGADDYLVKPFSLGVLKDRISALLHKPAKSHEQILTAGNLKIDILNHRVFVGDKNVRLTDKEFSLLEYFMHNPDKVVRRDQIINHLWGASFNSFSNVIDVHMKNLRHKLKVNKGHPSIETVHGAGYRMKFS